MPASVDTKKVDLRLAVTDDVPPGRIPYKIRCLEPEHDDPGASMAIYPDGISCFGCGFSLNRRMEALAYLLRVRVPTTGSEWAAFINKYAARYTIESLDNYRDQVKEEARGKPLSNGLALGYAEILWSIRRLRMNWLLERGLTKETISLFHLGHDLYRFTIPVYGANGDLITIRYRNDEYESGETDEFGRPIPKYSGYKGRNGTYLFPQPMIAGNIRARGTAKIFVTEGELDAIRLWQEGVPAVTATNGVRQMKYIPGMLKPMFPHINHLIIVSDQDEPGAEGARELMAAAEAAGMTAARVGWPSNYGKDVTEYLQNGGEKFW